MKKYLMGFILICCYPLSTLAATGQFISIIDAGSSGSRIHVYQVTGSNQGVPVITELGNDKIKPGLSSYASHPQDAGASLKPLLAYAADAITKAHGVVNQTPLYLMATAGMRDPAITPAQSKAIYQSVTDAINTSKTMQLKEAQTIPGKMEGVYDWIAVNYLEKHLFDNQTQGSLDLGGASTEVTFSAQNMASSGDYASFSLGTHQYNLFSHSFYGLGQDKARGSVDVPACFPKGYSMDNGQTGDFNYQTCKADTDNLLVQDNVSATIPAYSSAKMFTAFSGYYYTAQFFKVDTQFTPAGLQNAVNTFCALDWKQMQEADPTVPVSYLANYCFNGTFIHELLGKQGYHFADNSKQVSVKTKIDDTGVDWTIGAALYKLSGHQ